MKILVLQHFFIYYTSHSRRNFIQFQISRTKRRINFLHSSSFRSLRFYFRSSFLSFSLSSLLFLALCLYLSLCLSVYLYQSTYIYIYIHTCISTLVSVSKRSFITRTKQKQIRPVSDVYNVRQTSEKKHSLSIDRILRSTDDSRKFFSPVLCKKKNGGCLAYAFPGSRDFIINRNWKCGDIESILTRLSVE